MTGIEVAGVILAAPPLLVSWLEHYRQVFEYLGCWKKFRAEYRQCQTQVQNLELSLNFTLEKLYLPFVESVTELERLKETPDDNAWIEVETRLRLRLIKDAQPGYLGGLKDLKSAIQELRQDLAYDNGRFQVYKKERLKFTHRATPRTAALQKVDTQLGRLRRLLAQNDEIAELRAAKTTRTRSKNVEFLTNFWRHAQVAYMLIHDAWCCRCRSDHRGDLGLLRRSATSFQLDIDFLFSQNASPAGAHPWSRLTTRILKEDSNLVISAHLLDNSIATVSVATGLPPGLPRISDMCYAMSAPNTYDRCLGMLADAQGVEKYRVFLEGNGAQKSADGRFMSLGALLNIGPGKPGRKERYEIALVLASSHLQLHSSSWLEAGWSNGSVFFLVENEKPCFDRPYLRRNFAFNSTPIPYTGFDLPFATLGIILLELCFGLTLDDSPYRAKHLAPDGSTNPAQDREAAWEWAKDVVGESGQEYARAVQWCLEKWRVREDDPGWRAEFHSNVVEVLETAYKKTWPE
ncbi:hypothetical protein D6C86_02375 [Aureobasidium pullulans]|uniref:DUF7580 domain-containing protein n=1 Tax=Aureobasidium pullulans TaxID=5580 RepID=A0A4S9WHG0_AURPU|nr:hypothetical protein D6C94_02774 [Aureobasidium pullulans]THZ64754.1 hypothetical protein D6C86_02375 [Aureobasidium pullulans]